MPLERSSQTLPCLRIFTVQWYLLLCPALHLTGILHWLILLSTTALTWLSVGLRDMDYRQMPYFNLSAQTLSGRVIHVEAHPGWLVHHVKFHVWQKEDIHPFKQSLVSDGVVMDDSKMLGEYDVVEDSVINLVVHSEMISYCFTWHRSEEPEGFPKAGLKYTDDEWQMCGQMVAETIVPAIANTVVYDSCFSELDCLYEKEEFQDGAYFKQFFKVECAPSDISIKFSLTRDHVSPCSDDEWGDLKQTVDFDLLFNGLCKDNFACVARVI